MPACIRAYERGDLPLAERLPSLGRRFACLADAPGLEPWDAARLWAWVETRPARSPARHAGHLLLTLHGDGPWGPFDLGGALQAFGEKEREVFAGFVRVWRG